MPPTAEVDVLVIGAGIAGLWTAAAARRAGYSCIVVEHAAMGGGQTIASQGIIHGGIKYALGGAATRASRAIAAMPEIWRACLHGDGEVDLRGARVLSDRQYLWTTAGVGSRLMGLAASKAIRTAVERVSEPDRPDGLRGAPRGVDVYRVEEPVLEPRSVVASVGEFAESRGARVLAGKIRGAAVDGGQWTVDIGGREREAGVALRARGVVLAAGAGNQELLGLLPRVPAALGDRGVGMQRRPLHMVMVRSVELPALFGHCIAAMSDKPRVTVTSQRDGAGRMVWYVGGQIAEDGAERDRQAQIGAAQRELAACTPWVDLAGAQWATLPIDRAEGVSEGGKRPDEPVVRADDGAIVVWPTKLAFAPLAASRVVEELGRAGVTPSRAEVKSLEDWPRPAIAALPWDQEGVQWS